MVRVVLGGFYQVEQAGAWFWQPTPKCWQRVFPEWTGATGLSSVPEDVSLALASSRYELAYVVYALSCLLCFLVSSRANRGRILRLLHHLLSSSDLEARAASLAGLLGSANPAQAFSRAQLSLRALPLSGVSAPRHPATVLRAYK